MENTEKMLDSRGISLGTTFGNKGGNSATGLPWQSSWSNNLYQGNNKGNYNNRGNYNNNRGNYNKGKQHVLHVGDFCDFI